MRRCFNASHLFTSQRGQTVILVALILVAVAALAALFVAVIMGNQSGTGRAARVATLNNIAEAGLRYADFQLTYSAEGADWRPTPASLFNSYPYEFGDGRYSLRVTYNPAAIKTDDLLARFIKIECTAVLRNNPFLKRRLVAYKPLLLADYIRFITDKNRTYPQAQLGVASIMYANDPVPYESVFTGPIRANSNLYWAGSASLSVPMALQMYMGDTDGYFPRVDKVEIAGAFDPLSLVTPTVYDADDTSWATYYSTLLSTEPLFDASLRNDGIIRYADFNIATDLNGLSRSTRYMMAPLMNDADPTSGQSRYLLLTRDTGTWMTDHWTGRYGYGDGIYVDNFYDIQKSHDLALTRANWMYTSDSATYTDSSYWEAFSTYTPPGVEVIFHPDNAGTTSTVPVIELIRYDKDASGNDVLWKNSDGSDYSVDPVDGKRRIYLQYPKNGVLYLEGNARVSGALPQRFGSPTRYFESDTSRFYDVTLVSGGTIYIEGDILSPASRGLVAFNDPSNTRAALIARDNVCLNMSGIGGRVDSANTTGTPVSGQWQIAPGQYVTWKFRSFQPAASRYPVLYIRHAGLKATPLPNSWYQADGITPIPALLNLTIGATQFDWMTGVGTNFTYYPGCPTSLASSPRVRDAAAGLDWEVSVRALSNSLFGSPVTTIRAENPPGMNNSVAIAGFQVLPAKVTVDALVYAQEGSWYVLGGNWFNSNWPYTGSFVPGDNVDPIQYASGVPSYQRALGSIALTGPKYVYRPMIVMNGAITENHTADRWMIGGVITATNDVQNWLSKWSGPVGVYSEGLLSYTFDAGLRSTVYQDANGNNLLRLPKLPCPPGLILWEEE